MQWSEKPSKQTALTCPKKATKYNIRDCQYFSADLATILSLKKFHTRKVATGNSAESEKIILLIAKYAELLEMSNISVQKASCH